MIRQTGMRKQIFLFFSITFIVSAFAAMPSAAAGWPNFRGPNGDGICTEKGLLKTWPEGGPKLLWTLKGLGKGYSSVTFAGGKLLTMGDRDKKQYIMAFDAETRKELWIAPVGGGHGSGPRCTPAIDDGMVYGIGTDGNLVCVKLDSGQEVWRKNFANDFGGRMMSQWKFSESPLVDGDKVLCTPGGKDAIMAAINKKTGKTLWTTAAAGLGPNGKDGAGYASIVVSEACGIRQYVQMTGRGLIGVAAQDGRLLWHYNKVANSTANIPNPIVRGDHVFGSTSYGAGAALLKLSRAGDGIKAEEVYFLRASTFCNHHGGMILLGDHIYAGHGHSRGHPICVEFLTGQVTWKEDAPFKGSAAVLHADGHLIFVYEKKGITLVAATPGGYKQKGGFQLDSDQGGPTWAHPVIFNKKLYIRHNDLLFCFDIAAK